MRYDQSLIRGFSDSLAASRHVLLLFTMWPSFYAPDSLILNTTLAGFDVKDKEKTSLILFYFASLRHKDPTNIFLRCIIYVFYNPFPRID